MAFAIRVSVAYAARSRRAAAECYGDSEAEGE